MRSFLVVTIRSNKELDVGVTLVFSVKTFYALNISKIDRSFSAFVLNPEYPFQSLKSQVKSPDKTIFDVFNQAFSKGEPIRSKNWLASGGLYITENNTEALGKLTCNHAASIPFVNKSMR